jgi:phage-related baseplate assembly protein
MELTHEELKTLLKERVDEVTLIDLLNVTSEDIVEAFDDVIEKRRDQLLDYLGVEEDDIEF